LGALLENNTDPFSAQWSHSAEPILVSLIGGIQTFAGPLVGSVIFIVLREIIERFTQNWMLWFGIILLVIIMGLRGGVVVLHHGDIIADGTTDEIKDSKRVREVYLGEKVME
jgi:branched-chain amino acid transport system permease protein